STPHDDDPHRRRPPLDTEAVPPAPLVGVLTGPPRAEGPRTSRRGGRGRPPLRPSRSRRPPAGGDPQWARELCPASPGPPRERRLPARPARRDAPPSQVGPCAPPGKRSPRGLSTRR